MPSKRSPYGRPKNNQTLELQALLTTFEMFRINRLLFLPFLGVFLIFCGPSMAIEDEIRRRRDNPEAAYGDISREQILETRNRRKRQLSVMMMDARKKLTDHSAGELTLTEEQKSQLESSATLYQRKIDSMEVELEQWEIDRLIARETESANRRRERSQDSRRIKTEL
uniref:Uncharacterized protein n=1 Tax=Pseudo-nitzschia australis TaxID=44445 RepID=A0A6V0BUX4_9STRA|mmetsp:Transcript_8403/g.16272  ORF Transcript_8403/g.16272 Transcript_8403/m.16272 type:complete len:168 (+) Transcript_8403:7-510(+)